LHRKRDPRDALVLGNVPIGATHEHSVIGVRGCSGRPHLLSVDDEFVTVQRSRRGDAGEVGTGSRFAEQLAPGLVAEQCRRNETAALFVVSVLDDRRAREAPRHAAGESPRAGALELLRYDACDAAGVAAPVPVLRERRDSVARVEQHLPPLAQRTVLVVVLLEPGPDFLANLCADVRLLDDARGHTPLPGNGEAPFNTRTAPLRYAAPNDRAR